MTQRRKIILPFAVLGAGLAIAAAMIVLRQKVEPESREIPLTLVRTLSVRPQSHRFAVSAQGTVLPSVDVRLAAQVEGRVVSVAPSFAAGGFFETGDVLITIDPRDYELAVTRSRAALAEAEVALKREEAEAVLARREWESLGRGADPNPLVLREPQLAGARATIEAARATLAQAELDLDRCRIHVPFAGRIREKRVDIGQFIRRGDEVARVYSVDYAEVRLPLTLDEFAYLDVPLEFRGETPAAKGPRTILRARFGNETYEWEGRIVRTEGEIDARSRMLTVVARVDAPYGRGTDAKRPPFAVGLFVDAEIQGRAAGNVLLVPRAAMRGKDRLMVVDADSRLRLRPVEVIRFENDRVVLNDVLQPDERVCVSPLDAPVDGMKVRVTDETGAPATGPPTTAPSSVAGPEAVP